MMNDNLPPYEQRVVWRVRDKYTLDAELAILRQRDTKPVEFKEYFDYVEQVKKEEQERTQKLEGEK